MNLKYYGLKYYSKKRFFEKSNEYHFKNYNSKILFMNSWIYHSIVLIVSMGKFNFCTHKLYLCVVCVYHMFMFNKILTLLNPLT